MFQHISTHALTEGDISFADSSSPNRSFQLTPSRRATLILFCSCIPPGISTHALTEGDWPRMYQTGTFCYFNSRPHGGRRRAQNPAKLCYYFNSRPHGGRLMPLPTRSTPVKFQLTPSRRATSRSGLSDQDHSFQLTPSRRATLATVRTVILCFISTHALTEGDLLREQFRLGLASHFNSRPHGGRQQYAPEEAWIKAFQLTPSRRATVHNHER